MPVRLPLDASDETILQAVEKWIGFLVDEEYERAFDYTEHDKYFEWTPDFIKIWIANYGAHEPHYSGELFKVTSIDKVVAKPNEVHHRDIDYFEEPFFKEEINAEVLADIWYSLPLNNEWSDLIATFFVVRREDYLTLLLQEIHVF